MTNKKKGRGAKAAKKDAEPVGQQPNDVVPKSQGLSQAQFTALIFLSFGASSVINYGSAVSEGPDTKACANYFESEVDACSPADVLLIQAKYYTSLSCTFLVSSAILLCWTHETLFQSLNALLCTSPLAVTLVAAYASKGDIKQRKLVRLGMTVVVLLAVALSSIAKADLARPVTSRFSSLQHVCLLSLGLLSAWEAVGTLKDGVSGFFNVDSEDATDGTSSILKFLAVDKITVSFLFFFVLFFFDENRKRSMLLLVAMLRVGELFFQLPKLESDLRDAEGLRNMLIGSAIFSGIAALAPSLKRKRD